MLTIGPCSPFSPVSPCTPGGPYAKWQVLIVYNLVVTWYVHNSNEKNKITFFASITYYQHIHCRITVTSLLIYTAIKIYGN